MIISVLLFVVSFLFDSVVFIMQFIAKDFSVWPDNVLNGFTYFFTSLMNFDFILNTTELLNMLKYLIAFDVIYISIKLLLKLFNWVRGSGGVELNS